VVIPAGFCYVGTHFARAAVRVSSDTADRLAAARSNGTERMEMTLVMEPPAGFAAVAYDETLDVDAIFAEAVAILRRQGVVIAGLLQRFGEKLPNGKRSMWLDNIATGAAIRLDRPDAPDAAACVLDPDALARASCVLRRAVAIGPELIVVNRFGQAEADGRGTRTAITEAVHSGSLVLTAVRYNLLLDLEGFLGNPPHLLLPSAAAIVSWVQDHRQGFQLDRAPDAGLRCAPAEA